MAKKRLIMLLLVVAFFSQVLSLETTYKQGEILKLSYSEFGDFDFLKIITPTNTFMHQKNGDSFFLSLDEPGFYKIETRPESAYSASFEVKPKIIDSNDQPLNQSIGIFSQEKNKIYIEIGKSVRNTEQFSLKSGDSIEVSIPKSAVELSIEGADYHFKKSILGFFKDYRELVIENVEGDVQLTYYTPGPEKDEKFISSSKKKVEINSEFHYEDVLVESLLPSEVSSTKEIKLFWDQENRYLEFELIDSDGNGLYDTIQWVVPHLSTQTFEIIVISSAQHFNSQRSFIENIYSNVSEKDGILALIPDKDYVRVSFEKNLTNVNDITVYAQSSGPSPATIEVYEKDSSLKIAEIKDIFSLGYYKTFLTGLAGMTDTFDLKVIGGIFFDLIIDPIARPGGAVELRAQNCALQSLQANQNTFDLSCAGNYPNSCSSSGDRMSCDDANYETGQSYRFGGTSQYGGVRITASNTAVTDCDSISKVELCYKFWSSTVTGSTCYIGTSINSGSSWQSSTVTCASSESPSPTCVDVTSASSWNCSHFFGSSGTKAMAKSQAFSADNRQTYTWTFDTLFFNVTYSTPPLGNLAVLLNSPENQATINSYQVNFNYTPISSANILNCSLWDNSTGTWHQNMTNSSTITNGSYNFFTKTYTQSSGFIWNVRCCDSANGCSFAIANYSFNIDMAAPVVNLVSPENATTISNDSGLVFTYNTTDFSSIQNCSLLVDNQIKQTHTTVQKATDLSFEQFISNGTHTWAVSCYDMSGNRGWSENRTIYVSIPRTALQGILYETSNQSYTGSTTATISLKNSGDATQDSAAFSIPPTTKVTFARAETDYIGFNGAVIPAGSTITFYSTFDYVNPNNNNVFITWKLILANSSGDNVLCQNGNEGAGGLSLTSSTPNAQNTTCISSDIYLKESDKLVLEVIGYNAHGSQTRTLSHVWDGATSSYVNANISTEGFVDVDIVSPIVDPNVALDDTFSVICETSCSVGTCTDVNVYLQKNTSSTQWENVASTGNLVLNTGETNPHNLGRISSPINTTFTIKANTLSTGNNLRCIALGDYSSYNGTTHLPVTVTSANAAAPQVNLFWPENQHWFNSNLINLSYNVSDINDNIASTRLILNGQPNVTNQTPVINNQINNFSLSLPQGTYTWSVNATDLSSLTNSSVETRTFYIDTSLPKIDLNAPSPGESFNVSSIQVNFTPYDNMDGQLSCDLIVDGVIRYDDIIIDNYSLTSRTVTSLGTGQHFWNVTCIDNAGNSNTSATRNFTVYDLPPQVFLITQNYKWFNTNTINLTYNASDNNEINRALLFINGSLNTANQTPVNNNQYNNFTVTLSDNFYRWTVNVTDTAGYNATVAEKYFYVDTQSPRINLSGPSPSFNSASSSINFNFTVTDNLASPLTCNLSIGDYVQTGISATNGSLTNVLVTGLTDGTKTWNVSCVDSAGNYNISSSRQITIAEPPRITLTTANLSWFSQDVSLVYTPSDNTNLSNCSLYLNGVLNTTNNSVRNSVPNTFLLLGVANGYYSWYVRCADLSGLTNTSETRYFYKDSYYPQIQLHEPFDDSEIYDSNITFNFTITDNMIQNISCNITVDGQVNSTYAWNGTVTTFSKLLSAGTHLWNVSCVDSAGNYNISETRNFTSFTPPDVLLISPSENQWLNNTLVDFEYYAYKLEADIQNCSLYINDAFVESNSTPINNDASNFFQRTLSEGSYTWNVRCYDSLSAEGIGETTTFHIDNTDPSVNLYYPSNESIVDWNNVTFNFTFSDNLASYGTCDLYLNGFLTTEAINATNGSFTISPMVLNDGIYNWSVYCNDSAGNFDQTETNIFTLEAPPRITLYDPDDDVYNIGDITFTYLPEDAIALQNCSLFIDDIFNQSKTGAQINRNENNTFIVNGISEGSHNWTVECYDVFPDFNKGIALPNNFTVDKTAPVIVLNSPSNNSGIYYNSSNNRVYFNWTPTDLPGTLITCDLVVDGSVKQNDVMVSSGYSVREYAQGLSFGGHYWNVSCVDSAGNSNYSETRFFNLTYPDFLVNASSLLFNESAPKENQLISINSTVYNLGAVNASNVLVRLYSGHPDTGTLLQSSYINVSAYSYSTTIFNWTAAIGLTQMYIAVDTPLATNGSYKEWNESNNLYNNNISVGSWQFFYGYFVSGSEFQLADNTSKVVKWNITTSDDVNIYVADSESSISWSDLQALGKTKSGSDASTDFSELDSVLGMSGYEDSISRSYLDAGQVKNKTDYITFGNSVTEVPIIESINSSNFMTGILWDSSTDTDNSYDSVEKESVIFVTKVNRSKEGAYGTYDYEIRVPAKLREYVDEDSESAVFYLELL